MTKEPKAILVVEDDEDIRETLLDILRDEGFDALGAEDGVAALSLLRASRSSPSLILLDLMMPRMNGAEFRAEQLSDPAIAGIPVVVLSADANVNTKGAGLRAAACIRKPIKLQTLLDTIRELTD